MIFSASFYFKEMGYTLRILKSSFLFAHTWYRKVRIGGLKWMFGVYISIGIVKFINSRRYVLAIYFLHGNVIENPLCWRNVSMDATGEWTTKRDWRIREKERENKNRVRAHEWSIRCDRCCAAIVYGLELWWTTCYGARRYMWILLWSGNEIPKFIESHIESNVPTSTRDTSTIVKIRYVVPNVIGSRIYLIYELSSPFKCTA